MVVMITGLIRDGEGKLEAEIARLRRAFEPLGALRFFVVESDSRDATPQILRDLARNHRDFSFQSLGELEKQIPDRTPRLAYCRNLAWEVVAQEVADHRCDLVVVADLDGVNKRLHWRSVMSSFNRSQEWSALFANQPDAYDDIYALRHPLWSPNDFKKQERELQGVLDAELANQVATGGRIIGIPQNHRPIEVDSAFGGLGIYRGPAFVSARYSGRLPNGELVCEHVPFHLEMRSQGHRLFISPSLVNCYSRVDSRGFRYRLQLSRAHRSLGWTRK